MNRILPGGGSSLLDNDIDDYPLRRGADPSEWLYEMDF